MIKFNSCTQSRFSEIVFVSFDLFCIDHILSVLQVLFQYFLFDNVNLKNWIFIHFLLFKLRKFQINMNKNVRKSFQNKTIKLKQKIS